MKSFTEIAGMGEFRKKKKPKVKTKKDKSSIKIKEVNPFTKEKNHVLLIVNLVFLEVLIMTQN